MDVDPPIEDVEMEYYGATQPEASSSRAAATWSIVVDEAHPFDLDAYISGYSGAHVSRYSALFAGLMRRRSNGVGSLDLHHHALPYSCPPGPQSLSSAPHSAYATRHRAVRSHLVCLQNHIISTRGRAPDSRGAYPGSHTIPHMGRGDQRTQLYRASEARGRAQDVYREHDQGEHPNGPS
jgi:hypothetical protein